MRTSVEMMRWAPSQSSVPPASLTVLSQACRDSEEVRFEYQRPNREESTRLVQPHQLVSAGHRWYLTAWDVRRDDWRTFRIDRMVDPKLADVRFGRRELPAEDASAFVTEGIRTMSLVTRFEFDLVEAPDAVIATLELVARRLSRRDERAADHD